MSTATCPRPLVRSIHELQTLGTSYVDPTRVVGEDLERQETPMSMLRAKRAKNERDALSRRVARAARHAALMAAHRAVNARS